jgi:hypothetical protein
MHLLTRTVAAAVVAAILLALATTSAEAGQTTSGRCAQPGKTVAKNEVARVFRRDATLYSCLWSANRAEPIATAYDDDYTFSYGWSDPRLAGRYVAWLEWETDVSCKAECPPNHQSTAYRVNVIDLRTQESEWTGGLPAGSTLRVNRRGAVTWLESLGGGQRQVHAWDADGHRVLDTGVIRRASYALSGRRLTWSNGAAQRSATLR